MAPVDEQTLSQYKAGRIDLRQLMLTEGRKTWYFARTADNPGELALQRQKTSLAESPELPRAGFHHDHRFSKNKTP